MRNSFQQLKNYFGFTRRERRALSVLSVLLVLLLLLNLFPGFIHRPEPYSDKLFDQAVEALSQRKPSPKETYSEVFGQPDPDAVYAKSKLNPFPFDPNHLPEETWRKLGLAGNQIRAIKNYEKKGGKFLRKEDLAKIYTISETEYKILEPFIQIESKQFTAKTKTVDTSRFENKQPSKANFTGVIELNTADSLQLMQLSGIGPWTAHRLLKYRNRLGGFSSPDQLLQIKGIDSVMFVRIRPQLLADTGLIQKLNINKAEFRQLLSHPYLDMERTKTIVNHRERRGRFASWDEFVQIVQPDSLSAQRLRPYVVF